MLRSSSACLLPAERSLALPGELAQTTLCLVLCDQRNERLNPDVEKGLGTFADDVVHFIGGEHSIPYDELRCQAVGNRLHLRVVQGVAIVHGGLLHEGFGSRAGFPA